MASKLERLLRRLERKADRAFSLHIRARDRKRFRRCPLCALRGEDEPNPIQCCFHFISRRRKVLRWDPRNAVGACHTCNYIERKWPDLSRAWLIRQLGADTYLDMVDMSVQKAVFTEEGLLELIKRFGGA